MADPAELLSHLRCPECARPLSRENGSIRCDSGHVAPSRDGYLDLLDEPEELSLGQRLFTTDAGARGYERFRESRLSDLITGQRYRTELVWLRHELSGAERVLDVPAGQGNFTAVVARSAASVIGLDLSARMLGLASARLRKLSIDNVTLVRGTALALPIADGVLDAVSNCGGLHLYPDVPLAIREMRRVLKPGGRVAGLTFRRPVQAERIEGLLERVGGVRAFDFDELGDEFRSAGFSDFRWHGKRLVGWFTAHA